MKAQLREPEDLQNIDALIDAYCRGELVAESGRTHVAVFFAGRRVLHLDAEDHDEVARRVPEWQRQYGPGKAWPEVLSLVSLDIPRKSAALTLNIFYPT
jgi:hypothetical protein